MKNVPTIKGLLQNSPGPFENNQNILMVNDLQLTMIKNALRLYSRTKSEQLRDLRKNFETIEKQDLQMLRDFAVDVYNVNDLTTKIFEDKFIVNNKSNDSYTNSDQA